MKEINGRGNWGKVKERRFKQKLVVLKFAMTSK